MFNAMDWNLLCSPVQMMIRCLTTVHIMKMQVSGVQVPFTNRTMATRHAVQTYNHKLIKVICSLSFFDPLTQSVKLVMYATLEM